MEFGTICWIATELQTQVTSLCLILRNHVEYLACVSLSVWRIHFSFSVQSEKVGEAVLLVEFCSEPVEFQKNIPLIIMRTQRPARLSAGPFGWLTLELFAAVRNTAS
jgi:hypothetical protein